jgi:hypothetical protein
MAIKECIKKDLLSPKNDDFYSYLKRQQNKTTFNGIEIRTFSWYKKILGLV